MESTNAALPSTVFELVASQRWWPRRLPTIDAFTPDVNAHQAPNTHKDVPEHHLPLAPVLLYIGVTEMVFTAKP